MNQADDLVEIANINKEIVRIKEILVDTKEELKTLKADVALVKLEIIDSKLEAKDIKTTLQIESIKLQNTVKDLDGRMAVFSKYGYAINIFIILAIVGAVIALVLK